MTKKIIPFLGICICVALSTACSVKVMSTNEELIVTNETEHILQCSYGHISVDTIFKNEYAYIDIREYNKEHSGLTEYEFNEAVSDLKIYYLENSDTVVLAFDKYEDYKQWEHSSSIDNFMDDGYKYIHHRITVTQDMFE